MTANIMRKGILNTSPPPAARNCPFLMDFRCKRKEEKQKLLQYCVNHIISRHKFPFVIELEITQFHFCYLFKFHKQLYSQGVCVCFYCVFLPLCLSNCIKNDKVLKKEKKKGEISDNIIIKLTVIPLQSYYLYVFCIGAVVMLSVYKAHKTLTVYKS